MNSNNQQHSNPQQQFTYSPSCQMPHPQSYGIQYQPGEFNQDQYLLIKKERKENAPSFFFRTNLINTIILALASLYFYYTTFHVKESFFNNNILYILVMICFYFVMLVIVVTGWAVIWITGLIAIISNIVNHRKYQTRFQGKYIVGHIVLMIASLIPLIIFINIH